MNKKMNLNWSVDEITGNMPDISSMRSKEFQVKETSNTELLKDYLKRLGNGEDLESVRKDFETFVIAQGQLPQTKWFLKVVDQRYISYFGDTPDIFRI